MSKAYLFNDIAYNITTKKVPTEADMATYIGLEHLESGSLYVKEFGSKVPIKGEKLAMTKGDILLGKRNAYLRRAAIAPHDGLFSAHGMLLRPKTDVIDERFFPFFIASDYFFDEAIRISVGGLSPTINWKDLKNVEFELPTIEEQRVLADKLWAAYELKEAYKKMIAATDEMVKSQFIEMFGDLDTNVKSYPITTVDKVSINLFAGGDKPNDISSALTDKYTYPVWANGEGERGLLGYSKTYRVDKEALTISARGTIGHSAIREPYFTPVVRLITLIPNEKVDIVYLKHFFDQTGFESTGAVQGQLTIPTIKVKKVLVPPIEEQKKFSWIVKQADKSKFELQQAIDKIDKVMKSLLQ